MNRSFRLELTSRSIKDRQGTVFAFDLPFKQDVLSASHKTAAECLAAQTMMRSVVPPAFVVAAVAEAADSQRAFGTPEVLDLDHYMAEAAAAHNIAASRTVVECRNCSAPVLVASYLAVELVLQLLWDELLAACGPEPAAESLHEVIVPNESHRLAPLVLAAPVAPALENSSRIALEIQQC